MRIILFLLVALFASSVYAERIKDLASIYGVRNNQLVGYGIVVGLDGTGDQTSQTPFTVQSIKNMLTQYGITLPPGSNPQLKNVAAVSLHANLPAFIKPGQNIDVTVASLGNAKSLRGGSLLMSPLRGADGEVYALAQGNVIVGGLGVGGSDGSSVTINVPSTGRIPDGAIVERIVPNNFRSANDIILNLHSADFTTAKRLEAAINESLGAGMAVAIDAISIRVKSPEKYEEKVSYVSFLENLEIRPAMAAAKVIINSRTGTVVIGSSVRLTPAAVSHGSLIVSIKENPDVSQPNPLSDGQTTVVQNTQITVEQEDSRMFLFDPGVELREIVRAVNQVGAAPSDLVAILEALKQAGSLRAQLIVI